MYLSTQDQNDKDIWSVVEKWGRGPQVKGAKDIRETQ